MTVRADNGITDELTEKIFAFVDREAGRDAPLSLEDEEMVRELLLKNPAAQTLADNLRDVDRGLKAMFDALGRIPVSDDLMRRIRAQQEAFELDGMTPLAPQTNVTPHPMSASCFLHFAARGTNSVRVPSKPIDPMG